MKMNETQIEAHQPFPSFKDYLAATRAEAARLAPVTMIYTVSGTRRSAALAGLDPQSDAAIQWLRLGMLSCVELIFAHGVQHILMPLLTPSQFKETTVNYHEKLWKWVEDGLIGKQAVTDFQARGWQVRFLFADQSPRLQRMNASLAQATPERQAPCLWLYVIPQPGQLWQWMLEIFQEKAPQNQAQAIHQLYGADIPPATLSLDFGKPIVSPDLLPPFLFGKLDCYWSQRPGYSLDETQLRAILYDHAIVRSTWQSDKTGRAEYADEYRRAWENGPILGLGTRLGPHWYPSETSMIS